MSRILVAYFSAGGVTARIAKDLAKAAGADLYEIRPSVPYSKEDLDWQNPQSRSSLEMKDEAYRPPLADHDAEIRSYDTLFLGFPIWWYRAPSIIQTFLESYDFTDKTIILFATSGGSGFGGTIRILQKSLPVSTRLREGGILNKKKSQKEWKRWLKAILGSEHGSFEA